MHSPETVIAALTPVLLPERAERLAQVARARLAGLVVVFEHLHDPHNAAAGLRSCEAVGLLEARIIGDPLRFAGAVTQGSHKWLELATDRDIDACVAGLKARGFAVYAAVPGATTPLESLDAVQPAAFLIGNEHEGLSTRAKALADVVYRIPMFGFSESYDLSVSTALTVYTHAQRRRAALGTDGDLDDAHYLALLASYMRKDVRAADAIIDRYVADRGRAE